MSELREKFCTPLRQIADQIPLGFSCRSCGRSAYNWISNIDRYIQTGETCCADFRDWAQKADRARALRARTAAQGKGD